MLYALAKGYIQHMFFKSTIINESSSFFFRVFNPLKLQHIVTFPKPHFLGVNIAEGIDFR